MDSVLPPLDTEPGSEHISRMEDAKT
jgi:hypothetical protein